MPDAVKSLTSLRALRLDGNSFVILPPDLPPTITDLSITRNALHGWTDETLARLLSLKRLDLSKNNLQTITKNDINPLRSCAGESSRSQPLLL